MPEALVVGRCLITAELGSNGRVDQFGQVVRDFGIRAKTEEYVSTLAGQVLLPPDPAVAEIRNSANAVVEWNALLAVGLILAALAGRLPNFNVGQRQVVAVEQLGNFGGGGQRFVFGAAVVHGLGAQGLDAHLELIERGEIRVFGHGYVTPTKVPLHYCRAVCGTACGHGSGPRRSRQTRLYLVGRRAHHEAQLLLRAERVRDRVACDRQGEAT